jgi:hypothetical protein
MWAETGRWLRLGQETRPVKTGLAAYSPKQGSHAPRWRSGGSCPIAGDRQREGVGNRVREHVGESELRVWGSAGWKTHREGVLHGGASWRWGGDVSRPEES